MSDVALVARPRGPAWATRRFGIAASAIASAVGLLLLGLGLHVDATRAWFAYLQAWTFATTVAVGALIWLMTSHVSKAGWVALTRRPTEAMVEALPLLLVLFIPLCFGLGHLFAWANPGAARGEMLEAIEHKRRFLNVPFFIGRSVGYFAFFIAVGALLRAWSRENDARPRLALVHRMRALSGGALPVLALVLTGASWDWTMSLEPDWYSTIFGLYYFAGGFVGALALVCILLHLSRWRPELRARITGEHAQALGRVLFAMVIFWAYMAFSQLLIDWIGDVPEEIHYYVRRTRGSWAIVCAVLGVGHFAIPFFVLLNRRFKRSTERLAWSGAWMIAMHWVDIYWLVLPVHDEQGVRLHWVDLGALLFVAGACAAWVLVRDFRAPPLPVHDPGLAAAFNYEASV